MITELEAMGILYSHSRINPQIGCEQRFIAYHNGDVEKALDIAVKAIGENRWIPTEERLPELNINIGTRKDPLMISEPVYITIRAASRDTIGQNIVCPIPCFLSSNGNWYVDGNSLDGWVEVDSYDSGIEEPFSSNVEVVAWRPMLEPYEEVS